MALDIELPDDTRREKILLGLWYRARHSPGYRRRDEKVLGSTIDGETGLEKSQYDLLPEGEGIRGPDFVFACPVQPDRLAEETLLCDPEPDGTTPSLGQKRALGIMVDAPDVEQPGTTRPVLHAKYPTHEQGRAEEELAYLKRKSPEMNPRLRTLQGREAWTEKEAEAYAEMHYRWQMTLLAFARKGWVRLEPPTKFESDTGHNEKYASGVDDKGMPYIATVTPEGLEAAERAISGDPIYSKGAFSSVAAMPSDIKAKVASRNPWAHQKFLQEDGAGG